MKGLLVNGMRVGAWLLLVLAAGCAEDAVRPITRNSPPQTIAFLGENPDTTLYIQHLSWWGEDTDGEVTHYLFRFLYDAAEWRAPDTAWVSTTDTDSTFYLPVTDMLRFLAYNDFYGDFRQARQNFVRLPREIRKVSCRDCSSCAIDCPNGVRVQERLIRAQELLA